MMNPSPTEIVGALFICGSDIDSVCDSSGTLPGSCSIISQTKTEESQQG